MKDAKRKEIGRRENEGKHTPIARTARVDRQQNGEVEPLRSTARKQRGTDENRPG